MIDFRRMRELIRKEERMKMALARERSKAERITSPINQEGGGSGRTTSRVEEGAITLVILMEEYQRITAELKQQREELEKYLDKLNDLQRMCMRMRYINGLSCRRIADATYYSEFHVHHVMQAAEDLVDKMQSVSMDDHRNSRP